MAGSLTVAFNNGIRCPILGFGTWRATGEDAYNSVKKAIEIGYRHIDTAFSYRNEKEVGRAINEKLAEGSVERKDVFVVSKLSSANHKENMVVPALKKTLENLNLQYLDLYLIHAPWSTVPKHEGQVCLESQTNANGEDILDDIDPVETWRGMEECVELGLARSIGLSNFNSLQTDAILRTCRVKPVTNQVELHHFLSQEKLQKFSEERGIKLTAYRSLGGTKNIDKVMGDGSIHKLAVKYNKTPAQIILRWITQRGIIAIPKSVTAARIAENFESCNFDLSADDMKFLSSLNNDCRYCEFLDSQSAKHFPFGPNVEF